MNLNVDTNDVLLFWQVLFVGAILVQLMYFVFIYSRLAFYKPLNEASHLPPVSVIIAARNEYDNLQENLPEILEQDYPDFEVIVVNDSSYDDSKALLHALKTTHPRLRVVTIAENDRFDGGKKLAITIGIKAATHERILLTDADCKPFGKSWIKAMVSATRDEQDIVLGYSPYLKLPGFLNAVIRFDGMHIALNYMGFALAGAPYMGVGRNLSYPKKLFFEVGGFRTHYSLNSGDDDLLIQQIAHGGNTAICLSKDALVQTLPKTSWKGFWYQKRRHLTTGFKYRLTHRLLLVLQPLSLLIFLVACIALVSYGVWVIAVASAFSLRMLLQILIFRRAARLLGQKDLAFFAPVLEIVTLVFSACVHLANASSKQTKWKN